MAITSVPLSELDLSQTAAQIARRKAFGKDEFTELAQSIREHGVLQAIICRPLDHGRYEIVAGERRFEAAKLAGLDELPANIRELTDEAVIQVQLIENLQRKGVHPMEEAEGYHDLVNKYGHAVDEIHMQIGKSRSYVYGRMKLLSLCKKVREAFFQDRISESIALLLARIPNEKLQVEALKAVAASPNTWPYRDQPLSFRKAKELIHENYMLRLADASFPVDDEALNNAGPCGTCPKRTGNQSELFGDVKSADVCTDPVCFKAKTRAFGQRQVAELKAAGQSVITGKQAKKIAPSDAEAYAEAYLNGYSRLDDDRWSNGSRRKISTIVGKDNPDIVKLQYPSTGEVVDVVPDRVVQAAENRGGRKSSTPDPMKAEQQKKRIEKKARLQAYIEARENFIMPTLDELARVLFSRLHHDSVKILCQIRGFEPPMVKRTYGGNYRDYSAISKQIDTLDQAGLEQWIQDCVYAPMLAHEQIYSGGVSKLPRLDTLLKDCGVSLAKIRAALQPKKKKATRKKTAKKRPAKKKAAKKKATKKVARKRVGKRPQKKASARKASTRKVSGKKSGRKALKKKPAKRSSASSRKRAGKKKASKK